MGASMHGNQVAIGFCLGDELLQVLPRAHTGVRREDVGEASIVPADVPSDEAEVNVFNASRMQSVQNLACPAERDRHGERRLVDAWNLVEHRRGHGFPGMADANGKRCSGFAHDGILLGTFTQRDTSLAAKLIGAVCTCHSAPRGLFSL